MKYLFYFLLIFILASCGPKTAENSKYSSFISDLTELKDSLDHTYLSFSKIDNDSLERISKTANSKHSKVKSVYKSDSLDTKYEEIMLTARGAIYKKIKKYLNDCDAVNKEYEYSSKQYKTLKDRLINEMMNEEDALKYTTEEKNALILLNGEIKKLAGVASQSFSSYEDIFLKMDSIIEIYDNEEKE